MSKVFQIILDWSEVWALAIPLVVLLICRRQEHYLRPIIVYVFLAFFINLAGNILGDYGEDIGLPKWLQRNTFLYNIHSIVRFICFTSFFILLNQPYLLTAKKIVRYLAFLFVVINFSFFEDFNSDQHLSGRLLATEAFLLLLYCLQYYLFKLSEDKTVQKRESDFWVTTGLSIYVVINFFVFLFYVPMVYKDPHLAEKMWDIHNIAYIVLSVFLAKAFYGSTRR